MTDDNPLMPVAHRHHYYQLPSHEGFKTFHFNENWCYCTDGELNICICAECMRKYNDEWDTLVSYKVLQEMRERGEI